MIIRGSDIEATNGRKPYPLDGLDVHVKHLVTRVTTPENPFTPHSHEQPELWFIIKGQAVVDLDDRDHTVGQGDLIAIEPWVKHGLHTDSEATWICLG
jgi:quercetin dioxygenase-like cupin family protein